ncbi:MAG: Flagellar sensor histidine kinase FleS [Labilithrix sp.]|nr:Flagellar sensor histidine kinase FleS [Labilithrix sp.]
MREAGAAGMNRVIRYRILTIVLLGVLTSALSVAALVQLLTTSTANRVERARDAASEEVDRLARSPGSLSDPIPSGYVAMRAGVWVADVPPPVLPAALASEARAAVARARAERGRVLVEAPAEDGTHVVAARPVTAPEASGLSADAVAVVAYVVRPLPSLRTWQRIVALLAAATALLVGTAVYSVLTMNRGASAIRASLEALATDLNATVARPSVRELDGIADGIAELARKLAEARQQEERLARELAQNERLAALGRVAAGVAHEVRNPLASIKLRLDLAAASSPSQALPASAAEAIAHATSEIDRLDRLVADLLVVAGRAVGPKGSADVGTLVHARAAGLAAWARERGVEVNAEGSAPALVDEDAMARAVDNLLRNAIEASPSGGAVSARVIREQGRVIVRVEDQGPGVPAARAAELFEPFFTTKPAGTGLGLALSRAIARAHGGDVVYERRGDVTCFVLSVAVARASEREAA